MKKSMNKRELEKTITANQFINSEKGLQRFPAIEEQELLNNIRSGNYSEIRFINFSELEPYTGKTTTNMTKKYEYYAVSAIALGTRAAIDGGLSADLAYDISDALLEKLAATSDIDEVHTVMLEGLTFLAHQVYTCKRSHNSYLVEQVRLYIARNIFQKIHLKDIAAYVDVNPAYLSHLFSEKAGITIQNYIQQEKINRACNLLRFSNSSIAEIAQYMSYQSQSHFTEVFKKYQGVTPTQYRNAHKSTAFN